MGFERAKAKDNNPLSPYERAHALLQNLEDGVDLILLCAQKDGVNAPLRNLYWLLNTFFFGGRAQIALVLTHFDVPHKGWWDRNKNVIAQRCNIPAQNLPHVCITTVRVGSPRSNAIYDQSRQALKALLQEHATTPTPLGLDLSSEVACVAAAESLNTHCQLSILNATTLVEKFRLPKRLIHAIFFGERGAGKSSVINLIIGNPVAEVAPGLDGSTLDYRSYTVNTGLHQFVIWDTVGFNGIHNGHDLQDEGLERAARLIHDLRSRAGIELLLVFCKKHGRLTPSELNTCRFFREFLCEDRVPVAFIITHLGGHNPMEKWWETNGEYLLKACNLETNAVAGHACITSAPDDPNDQKLHDKLLLSRQSVLAMLEDSTSHATTFNTEVIRGRNPPRKKKITVKNLMDRCALTKERAEKLIKLLYPQG